VIALRTKILGLPCHDVDIVIEGLEAETFATELTRQLQLSHRHCEAEAAEAAGSSCTRAEQRVGIIKENASKSKHFRIATLRLYALDIEICGLRSAPIDGSQGLSTAQQDASMRDFTINAMFYNVHHKLIEDFTGMVSNIAFESSP
jgi:tRNA nucleotidyltransferase (CCA-adding enzyme)